jgi:predicted dinucleotide-binding enzyme
VRIGIAGAGKLGTTLARRAVAAGHDVLVAGRPGAPHTALVVEVMVPGATAADLATWGEVDLAVLAVPFSTALTIDLPLPAGTIVIDPANHWEPVDGDLPDLGPLTTSEAIGRRHPTLRWVKSLNQLGYHDLEGETGVTRPAMGIATDHDDAAAVVAAFVESLGLTPVIVGPLRAGSLLEPGGQVFGSPMTGEEFVRHTGALAS